MDYVQQAFDLSDTKKQAAKDIFKSAVTVFVNKNYIQRCADAHVDLSGVFGELWLVTQRGSGEFWMDAALYAEANVAFNYANMHLGMLGKFIKTAESLVSSNERVSSKELKHISKQMDSLLTATTAEQWEAHLQLKYA